MAQSGSPKAVFVSLLATGSTVTDAARTVGVSRRTATRWFNEPELQVELAELQRSTLAHARGRLFGLVDAAADTLAAVMAAGDAPAARVSAARTVLAQALRLDERVELEERLERIEQAIELRRAASEGMSA